MPSSSQGPEALRRILKDKTVYLLPYCHADIAWTHTRFWHVNRYVLVLDEVLELMGSNPEFCYFVDSWTEMLRPYLEVRPQNKGKLERFITEGRLALCGGHWGNLRMTQAGNETIVRNITMGREHVLAHFPDLQPTIYSNLDVGIGHSQVPQIMRLGGFTGYFAWRPSAALDAQGVPRSFLWEGISGDRVQVCRFSYAGLLQTPEGKWSDDWERTFDILNPELQRNASQPEASAIGLCVGMDDSRPLRKWADDEPCRTDELIEAWNASIGRMRYGTPEHLFRDLAKDKLPLVQGCLDQADVCYNLNFLGERSLAVWREKADRSLVEAELLDAVASMQGMPSAEGNLRDVWAMLLDASPHAQQMLFDEDEQECYHLLVNAVHMAEETRDRALSYLMPTCLPLDCTHLAFVNTHPSGGVRLIRALVPNHDRTKKSFALLDEEGQEAPVQFTEAVYEHDEWEVELALELPPCGVRALRLEWRQEPVNIPAPTELPMNAVVAHAGLSLRFADGRLVEIMESSGERWSAAGTASFLSPVVQNFAGGPWLPDSLSEEPVPTKIEKLSIDGVGPVRTRVTRLVEAGANRFTQHLDIYGPQKEIRVTTEMTLKDENIFAGLAVPVPPESQLTVDIPFGMERRQPDAIPYGKASEFGWENIERRIPGYFWGRSWVNVSRRDGAFSLLSEDGDRFFRQHPSGSWLVHYFLRVPRRTEGCWEANAGMDRGLGRHVFHHVLVLHGAGFRMADLVNRAEQARFPVSWLPVCLEEEPLNQSWLSVEPETVQISSFYRQGDYAVLRVYNPQETAQSVQVIVPRAPQNVVLTDFNLNPMEGDVRLKKRTLQFDIRPWQIATFRLEF